jgi:methylmalonyl-CoA mutase
MSAFPPPGAGFPAATEAEWRALVARTLGGAGPEALAQRTADGLEIQPLYPPDPNGAVLPRPPHPEGPWDIRERVAHPDPAEANRRLLEALAGGATSALLTVAAVQDLPTVLDGVVLEAAGVALDAGFAGPTAGQALSLIAKGSPRARLAFHLDPLTAFAEAGRSPGPIAAHVEQAARVAARWRSTYPQAGLFLATGRAVHEAGGTPAQELATMAAAAVAYARAMVAAGLPMDDAFAGQVLGVSLDAEPLMGAAKLRAARLVWSQLTAACGVDRPGRIQARSSRRMLSRRDPWTNLLRLACAAFAGAAGGADALVIEPYDQPLGLDGPLGRRLARNTQAILMDEACLGRVQDPAAGSGFLEAHGRALAEAAWGLFQVIERQGGLAAALGSGWLAGQVATAREAQAAAVRTGEASLLGVTLHPSEPAEPSASPRPPAAPAAALPGPDDRCPRLAPVRWAEPFEAA